MGNLNPNLKTKQANAFFRLMDCACGRAFTHGDQEVSEKLDCVPAQFFVLRHIRGKYACACSPTQTNLVPG